MDSRSSWSTSRGVTSHRSVRKYRTIANALNIASTSREIPHEFRYHAKVLNDHLADMLRSALLFHEPEAHVRNPGQG
jgi:hypothetical protein